MGDEPDFQDGQNCDQVEYPEIAEEWVVRGWKLWAGGLKNWSAISREVGHARPTVRKRVRQYQKALSALYDDPDTDPRVEVLEGLQQDLEAQLRMAMGAERVKVLDDGKEIRNPDYQSRIMARREVTAIRKLRAGIQGVSTEKVTQVNEGALTLNFADNLTPEEQVESARLLAKASNGQATELPDGLPEVTGPAKGGA